MAVTFDGVCPSAAGIERQAHRTPVLRRALSDNGTASGVSEWNRVELPPSTVPMRVSGVCGVRRGRCRR